VSHLAALDGESVSVSRDIVAMRERPHVDDETKQRPSRNRLQSVTTHGFDVAFGARRARTAPEQKLAS